MTDNKDREIHEKLMGEHWHSGDQWEEDGYGICDQCNHSDPNPSYLDPTNYFKLLKRVKELDDEKWEAFLDKILCSTTHPNFSGKVHMCTYFGVREILLDEVRGREEIYRFFIEQK